MESDRNRNAYFVRSLWLMVDRHHQSCTLPYTTNIRMLYLEYIQVHIHTHTHTHMRAQTCTANEHYQQRKKIVEAILLVFSFIKKWDLCFEKNMLPFNINEGESIAFPFLKEWTLCNFLEASLFSSINLFNFYIYLSSQSLAVSKSKT